eukprot:4506631-Ditylum_brightwellii.AAC.1
MDQHCNSVPDVRCQISDVKLDKLNLESLEVEDQAGMVLVGKSYTGKIKMLAQKNPNMTWLMHHHLLSCLHVNQNVDDIVSYNCPKEM